MPKKAKDAGPLYRYKGGQAPEKPPYSPKATETVPGNQSNFRKKGNRLK